MPEYIFEQTPLMKDEAKDIPRLFFSANDALLVHREEVSQHEMAKHWGVNSIDDREHSAVKIIFATGSESQQLDDALRKLPKFAPDDPFTLVRWIGPGVFVSGLAWSIECSKANCTTFDIQLVKCARDGTETIIQEVKDVSASQGSTFNGEKMAKDVFVADGEIVLVKAIFTSLPYVDASGNMSWGDACNPVPCMGFRVHALTEDSCLSERITGCGASGAACCIPMPCDKCNTPTLIKNCQ
jgi:hypothetical protein